MPVAVITGATGGIGRWIALGLARAGHDVMLVGRNRQRGDDTLAWIGAQQPDVRLDFHVADLSSLAATRLVAERIAARAPVIDVLVNNAGVFCTRREETDEGHERVIAVNHLAPCVLTRALLPALSSAPRARIVNVGSSTSDRARIDPSDLEGKRRWGMVHAYAQSKLALMMATFGWAQRLQGTAVTANVVHPGLVATGLVQGSGLVGLVWRGMAPFALTAEQGADTPLHVALSAAFAEISGTYVKRRRVVQPNRRALDSALVEQVWRATEALLDESITGSGVVTGPVKMLVKTMARP